MFRTLMQPLNIVILLLAVTACQSSKERVYFIAADEIEWDYAPAGQDLTMGMPFTEAQNIFVKNTENRIGKIYLKAVYREYTDDTFSTLKKRDEHWQHLGILAQ